MRLSKETKLRVKQVAGLIGLTVAGTVPAWAAVQGLGTDIGHVIDVASNIPTLLTIGAMGGGTAAMAYGGWHIHKKGEMESQGKQVGMKHIMFPIAGGAFLAALPWMTGSAQQTFFGNGSQVTASDTYLQGNHLGGSQNVQIP
ncbi:hypothetical protein JKG47_04410 [Acidithiobacillus sp. MC6.1]|nr:hypothetical protein [Acidithiobacillus sp. MC6.1]